VISYMCGRIVVFMVYWVIFQGGGMDSADFGFDSGIDAGWQPLSRAEFI